MFVRTGGGGICATVNILCLTALQVPNVTLYDDSLSGWVADPANPMEPMRPAPSL